MIKTVKSYFSTEPKIPLYTHKYLVIPDLHGIYTIYKKVEDYIKNETLDDRKIIFLGDYVDRGEEGDVYGKRFKDAGSYYIIRDLIKLKEWGEQNSRDIIFLRGNHEVFYEEHYINGQKEIYKDYKFLINSMECFDYVFEKEPEFYKLFLEFLENLRPYYIDEDYKYLFVHAGIDPENKNLQEQVDSGLIYWIRDKFLFSEKKLDYTVVFGHTPFIKPFMRKDKIGLDSGVYKRDYLNMLLVDNYNSKIIQLHK
jgi:serine/threonine protein phosphatase 1